MKRKTITTTTTTQTNKQQNNNNNCKKCNSYLPVSISVCPSVWLTLIPSVFLLLCLGPLFVSFSVHLPFVLCIHRLFLIHPSSSIMTFRSQSPLFNVSESKTFLILYSNKTFTCVPHDAISTKYKLSNHSFSQICKTSKP